jgi:hypothetical protein
MPFLSLEAPTFFKIFGTPCRSYEPLSKLGALNMKQQDNFKGGHWAVRTCMAPQVGPYRKCCHVQTRAHGYVLLT